MRLTPDPLTIEPGLVARKAIELAEANPEFVYEIPTPRPDDETYFLNAEGVVVDEYGYPAEGASCLYVHETGDGPKGGCVFGQALLAVGLTPEELAPFEQNGISALFLGDAVGLKAGSILDAMSKMQTRQDGGDAWGKAVEPLKAWFAKRELVVSAA